jgi:hypothetical protein
MSPLSLERRSEVEGNSPTFNLPTRDELDATHCAAYGKSRQLAEVRFVIHSGPITRMQLIPLSAISRHGQHFARQSAELRLIICRFICRSSVGARPRFEKPPQHRSVLRCMHVTTIGRFGSCSCAEHCSPAHTLRNICDTPPRNASSQLR